MLCAVYDARLKRAASRLARAENNVERACADEQRAQTASARLQNRADGQEGEWHRACRHVEAHGRNIHDARAALERLDTLLAHRAEHIRACVQATLQARRVFCEAQQRSRAIARKEAKFRALLERVDAAGRE
jgi:hypothetical protein